MSGKDDKSPVAKTESPTQTSRTIKGETYFKLPNETEEVFLNRVLESVDKEPNQTGTKPKPKKQPPRGRGRSKSREPNRPSSSAEGKISKDFCKYYEESGFCMKGVSCPYPHNYNRPLSTCELRKSLDVICAQLAKVRLNQGELRNIIDKQGLDISNQISNLTSELKKLGLTSKDAVQIPHGDRQSIKNRVSKYVKKPEYKF
ncbi:MAG: hypothetical protein FuLiV2_gp5 [Hangzhou lispivirus 1]|uniref:C3H1-type domain-containing protein n=1 Tax=Hangzhou lispivirus 1 TaxID=2905568 RepID=A0A8K1XHI5_9MONO|nr:MAG: hypothetical protein FuLiV2_gp5 [Hangzhou lispivirus 1]